MSLAVPLLGAFEDLDEPPALGRRQRAGLHQRDAVADAGIAVLVVRLDLLGGPDDLAVQRVLHPVFQLDDDRLLHLVRHHVADRGLAGAPRLLGARGSLGSLGPGALCRWRLLRRGWRLLCHYDSSPSGPVASPNS